MLEEPVAITIERVQSMLELLGRPVGIERLEVLFRAGAREHPIGVQAAAENLDVARIGIHQKGLSLVTRQKVEQDRARRVLVSVDMHVPARGAAMPEIPEA